MGKRTDLVKLFGIPRIQECENCKAEIEMHGSFPFGYYEGDDRYDINGFDFSLFCQECYHVSKFKLRFTVEVEKVENPNYEHCDYDEIK